MSPLTLETVTERLGRNGVAASILRDLGELLAACERARFAPTADATGDMGRTPILTRSDLLLSQNIKVSGRQSVRLELNVINLFNQKTATHIFNFVNKGAPGESSFIS